MPAFPHNRLEELLRDRAERDGLDLRIEELADGWAAGLWNTTDVPADMAPEGARWRGVDQAPDRHTALAALVEMLESHGEL